MSLTKEERDEVRQIIESELFNSKKMYIQLLDDSIPFPKYSHESDAGMDLRASEDVVIKPGENKIIPTGLKIVIPKGYELQIRSRSGISAKTPLRISNGVGTIDSGYRNEIGVIITNTSKLGSDNICYINEKGNTNGTYVIKKGDRIAQMVLCKYEKIILEKVDDVRSFSSNRMGGFGSSGVR